MARYTSSKIINNSNEFYEFLRKKRGVKNIKQHATIRLKNPGSGERQLANTVTHVWSYGDRYFKLAAQYYGRPEYWWVIAWWNGRPTEADVDNGTALQIPTDLEQALQILGAH